MVQIAHDLYCQVYVCMALVTFGALAITFAKIKVVEAIEVTFSEKNINKCSVGLYQGTPDPRISTFKPLKQRTETDIMYVGIGFVPEDWYFYHSKVKNYQIV